MSKTRLALCYFVLALVSAALAQRRPAAAAPVNTPSAAPIRLVVDASEAPRKIFHARLTLPAAAGEMTLVYPKWIPGEHGPTGPVTDMAGLRFIAGGQTLAWRRDDVDMYALHFTVPPGATTVEATLDYLSPTAVEGFSSGASATAKMTVVSWNQMLLYPANTASDAVMFQASLKLPAGWKFGTALPVASQTGDTVEFAPANLTTLVDSPVITGQYYRTFDLSPGQTPSHEIDAAADSAAALEMPEALLHNYRQLVAETGALYGSRHYRDYHFLLSLSDYVAHFGLEHHESSDDRVDERTLTDETLRKLAASLLPHEFTHSWNGKYRRPAGLATPNFQEPMKGELLWVYEGLTEYLGDILAARSGLWTPEQYRDNLARVAAYLSQRPGRTWRPLIDTTVTAQLLYGSGGAWASWRRSVDFYDEGELIWLDVDVTIRQQTQNKKSMDDFTRLFHGGPGGAPALKIYTFDDVVAALNQVTPYDWRKFLTDRLNSTAQEAPLGGVIGGGWRLVYDDQPGDLAQARATAYKTTDASFSIGLLLRDNGGIGDVILNSPAYKAGIGPGMKVIAVNGRRYSPEVLYDALRAGKNSAAPLELLVENGEYFAGYRLDYHDGPRYPHLVREASKPDLLSEITKQHAPSVAPAQ